MKSLLLTVVSLWATQTLAKEANVLQTCLRDGTKRDIELAYTGEGKVPCVINYTKTTEAPGQTVALWRADNQEGFCEMKLAEFVEKLRAAGFSCETKTSAASEAAPASEKAAESGKGMAP